MRNRNTTAFLILCAIWGTTWIGIKAGVDAVPPLMFAGARFTAAGALLFVLAGSHKSLPKVAKREWPRLLAVSMLMIALSYGPLFWGMRFIPSGSAAVLELSLTPVALLGFALLMGEEAFSVRRLFAILLGTAGLLVLFGPDAYAAWFEPTEGDAALRVWGALAVASAAVIYAYGSVLARPLLRRHPPALVASVTTFVGGVVLIAASLLFESGAAEALRGRWGWAAWSGWLFLVLFGSLVGYTIYMRLLRDVGASQAGAYAFVSPVIAVVLGVLVMDERVTPTDVGGMLVMLAGAYLAMTGEVVTAEQRQAA